MATMSKMSKMTTMTKLKMLILLALVLVFFIYLGNGKLNSMDYNKKMANEETNDNKKETSHQYAKKYNTISNYNCNSSINPCK